ncbi:1-acyl-sn-glycerol-3-phosphate acyltransferase [Membranihabitans marinus]|uniref:1-acyl-sn-glycerol-3-phosphate acyltransferase n=1 Tax=Membranihabitans marinus TaxID=1227546 RepID=UPI001F0089D8|nr:1-acyl-sn-glycerol-3-phosphate acyltransferase [Membranihabitans marinus]
MKENKKVYQHIKPNLKDWPIYSISENRANFVDRLVNNSYKKLYQKYDGDFEDILEKTIYQERIRIKRTPWRVDPPNDEAFWNKMKNRFGKSKRFKSDKKLEEFERKSVYRIVQKYSEEIVGSFVPKTFLFARKFLTAMFNMLLGENLFKKSWKIWGKRESLYNALKVYGDIDKIRNLADKGTVIIVPTHFSNLDSILIGYVVDTKLGIPAFSYGAGLNLYNFGPAAYFMNRLGAYRVDRRKKNAIYLETLKVMSALSIKSGVNNLFFPEGTRSRSGSTNEKLKLGLLNSIIEAQRDICINNLDQKVFIVPLILDYHFVLEAKSLIRQHLTIQGREKYSAIRDLGKSKRKIFKFIWEFYSKSSEIVCSFGDPIDFIGNKVDFDGNSMDRNGKVININEYFISEDGLASDVQRESEYTKLLAAKIVERFKRDNVVLSSHMIAYLAFEMFKHFHPNLDLFGLLKMPMGDFIIPKKYFIKQMDHFITLLKTMEEEGAIRLSSIFEESSETVLMDGLSHIGLYHSRKPLKLIKDNFLASDDLELLYYYHNRLDGYHFKNIFKVTDQDQIIDIFREEE